MSETFSSTTQRITASGVIGVSGRATRIFNIYCLSGGDVADFNLRNGTSASGTIFISKGVANPGFINEDYGRQGHVFPAGCYVEFTVTAGAPFIVSYSQ